MKIAVDISSVIYGTGVSEYTKNLVEALISIDKEDDFILFGGSLRRSSEIKQFIQRVKQKNVSSKVVRYPPSLLSYLWNTLHKYPIEKMVGPIDVLHSSDWTQPPTKAFKVTTIHDLVPLRFPNISNSKIVATHKKRLNWVKREADRIISVSNFTKKEIVEILQIDPKKIVVIPEAPDPTLKKSKLEQIENTKKKLKVEGDYLLVVGADPRKNVQQIINAFEKIKKETGLKLVITGRLWNNDIKGQDIYLLGHIERADLINLYSGATALVYASSYEGFGLPILEAMKLGCPVITSNISSMPEVAGDAGILVDPNDSESIQSGLEKMLKDRVRWINRGRKHVQKFSWVETAQLTLKVYREAKR
jgi:glycosyltransferase involved in cell wall biosynthesis